MKHRNYIKPVTENFIHSFGVGAVAYYLAEYNHQNEINALVAGCLHDLGGAVPINERIDVANFMKVSLYNEELRYPLLIHDKLGYYFSKYYFQIQNDDINNSILYHTTCIDNASSFEKIIFIADKIQWDRNEKPPYLNLMIDSLKKSLNEACITYISWLYESGDLKEEHPFLQRSKKFYIDKQKLPVFKFKEDEVNLEESLLKKYYLPQIKKMFYEAFSEGDRLLKKSGVKKAFLAGTLYHLLDSVSEDEFAKIYMGYGNNKTAISKKELIKYMIKNEFNIDDKELFYFIDMI